MTSVVDSNFEVHLKGKFTFADRQKFRQVFDMAPANDVSDVVLDFEEVEFIDSAALGILLLARDDAKKFGVGLIIRKPQGQVKKMFEISRFHDLFQIKD